MKSRAMLTLAGDEGELEEIAQPTYPTFWKVSSKPGAASSRPMPRSCSVASTDEASLHSRDREPRRDCQLHAFAKSGSRATSMKIRKT